MAGRVGGPLKEFHEKSAKFGRETEETKGVLNDINQKTNTKKKEGKRKGL